ncbi:MAG TPA: hypothetical protein VFO03_13190 [Gaiellaceae bacterium]|nr:hypothetical protein [Gaiellaceae bacterium]
MNRLHSLVESTPGEGVSAPTRELAQRRSGTVEVLLLWRAEIDRVELSLHDSATDGGFHVEVAPGDALEAFYHPYAYAATHEIPFHVVETEDASDDG